MHKYIAMDVKFLAGQGIHAANILASAFIFGVGTLTAALIAFANAYMGLGIHQASLTVLVAAGLLLTFLFEAFAHSSLCKKTLPYAETLFGVYSLKDREDIEGAELDALVARVPSVSRKLFPIFFGIGLIAVIFCGIAQSLPMFQSYGTNPWSLIAGVLWPTLYLLYAEQRKKFAAS